MKRSRAWPALVVAAFMTAGAFAQDAADLQKQIDELKAAMRAQAQSQASDIRRLESENAGLKAQLDRGESAIETEVNRLAERAAGGTNLRSCASAIKMGGEFRYRRYIGTGDGLGLVEGGTGPAPVELERDGYWGDMRTRLNFQYDFGCDVTAFAEVQMHEGMGEEEDGPFAEWDGNDNDHVPGTLGMYQTWVEARNVFGIRELSARVGRQEVVLGNQFQFGNADWYNGVVHDGFRADWSNNCWSLTVLAMKLSSEDGDFNQVSSFFDDHDDDELYSAYVTLKSLKSVTIDAYWIYINGHGGFAHNSGASFFDSTFLYPGFGAYYHTFGARAGGTFNVGCGLDWNVEGAVQTGDINVPGLDVDGWSGEAEIGMTFSKTSKFRVFARGLFAEGPADDSVGYLTNFPNRHTNGGFRARYGLADMMPMTNVISLQAGVHFDPICNWTFGATGLWAETEEDFAADINSEYGTELDLWAEWRWTKDVHFVGGIAFVFPDDSGQLLWSVTDDTQVVAYFQTRLVF
jgi:hypothetical protein